MINNLLSLLTFENIYLIANWGVIPFWLLLVAFPNHQITNLFVQSVIIPLLLAAGYAYLSYNIYLDGNIFNGFEKKILLRCKKIIERLEIVTHKKPVKWLSMKIQSPAEN